MANRIKRLFVSKAECVREGFRTLGVNTTPNDIIQWVEDEYNGLDVSNIKTNFTLYRDQVMKEDKTHYSVTTVLNGKDEVAVSKTNIPNIKVDVANAIDLIERTQRLIFLSGGKDNLKRLIDLL